jgi:hypothetical protein
MALRFCVGGGETSCFFEEAVSNSNRFDTQFFWKKGQEKLAKHENCQVESSFVEFVYCCTLVLESRHVLGFFILRILK